MKTPQQKLLTKLARELYQTETSPAGKQMILESIGRDPPPP